MNGLEFYLSKLFSGITEGSQTSTIRVTRVPSASDGSLSPHSLAIGDEMRNEDINTLIFNRPIPMNGFSPSDSNLSSAYAGTYGSPRSPNISSLGTPHNLPFESAENDFDSDEISDSPENSASPEYSRMQSPSFSHPSPGPSSRLSDVEDGSGRFSNSSNASNSPEVGGRRAPSTSSGQLLESGEISASKDDKEELTKESEVAETEASKRDEESKDQAKGDPISAPASNSSLHQDDGSDCGRNKAGGSEDGGDGINPMVSDVDDLDENDDALRGDRIGATTYSERHVLKILIKWVQVSDCSVE
jgi:hypothetical protein